MPIYRNSPELEPRLPSQWDGCPHVVVCGNCCDTRAYRYREFGCFSCLDTRVRWNGRTLPENMENAGYWVCNGLCFWKGVVVPEVSVIAAIWELSKGPVVPPPTPVDLSLLGGTE